MNDIDSRVAGALKRVSERHLDEAPLGPRGAQQAVVERVRRRWRSFLVVNGLVAVLVISSVVFMVPRLMSGTAEDSGPSGDTVGQPTPTQAPTPTPSEFKRQDVIDAQMFQLLKAVRPVCRSYDFQLEEKIQGRKYRPAYCKSPHRQMVLIFSFATEGDRRAWKQKGRRTQFSLPGKITIVTGDTWEMHFIDDELAQEIATELDGRVVEGGGQ
jgi:hypothetical protein